MRAGLAARRFVSHTVRPPDEVLPDPSLVTVIDQGAEPVSVGAGLASVLNYLRATRGETAAVSIRMLYEFALRYDEFPGTDYDGTSLAGGVAALSRHGVCLESEWPAGVKGSLPPDDVLESALGRRPQRILHVSEQRRGVARRGVRAPGGGGGGYASRGVGADGQWSYSGGNLGAGSTRLRGRGVRQGGVSRPELLGEAWGGFTHMGVSYPGIAVWSYEDAAAHLLDAWVLQLTRAAVETDAGGV